VIKNRDQIIQSAKELRINGLSHRQIASKLHIGLGTALMFTKDIKITWEQHLALKKNGGFFKHTHEERSKWTSRGSNNWFSHIKHSKDSLLQKISIFYTQNARIPTKREFDSLWQAYHRVFGSWNQAILAAGLSPNPQRFTHKFAANDGHVCDSLAEKIIDDWFSSRHISHDIHVYYPGQKKYSADFFVYGKWIEFLGLKGQLVAYDLNYEQKQKVAHTLGIDILEILPEDIFPQSRLSEKLGFLVK